MLDAIPCENPQPVKTSCIFVLRAPHDTTSNYETFFHVVCSRVSLEFITVNRHLLPAE